MICPYCNREAEWVENKEIYGKNYGKSIMMWLCRSCDAHVGCHNNTKRPLGTMADYITRHWRKRAHENFDPLWKGVWVRNSTAKLNRERVYNSISNQFGFRVHIGEADEEMCKKIISWCQIKNEKHQERRPV